MVFEIRNGDVERPGSSDITISATIEAVVSPNIQTPNPKPETRNQKPEIPDQKSETRETCGNLVRIFGGLVFRAEHRHFRLGRQNPNPKPETKTCGIPNNLKPQTPNLWESVEGHARVFDGVNENRPYLSAVVDI